MFKDQLKTKEIREFLALQPFIKYREDIAEYIVLVRDGYKLLPCDVIFARDHAEAIHVLEYRKRKPQSQLKLIYEIVCVLQGEDNFYFLFGSD